ncbi:hypothetical protein QA601_11385 [Chitinispirillales bacterium ANBcel5]|uniref:hypothetical protein n=1 Tax=Cellulosispirillum alkaliphilum TaxID=3039283 RepID=UPI002A543F7F|nr:hypothetical protein [Chitinispirillales bacterium ANBcel5]
MKKTTVIFITALLIVPAAIGLGVYKNMFTPHARLKNLILYEITDPSARSGLQEMIDNLSEQECSGCSIPILFLMTRESG